MTQGDPADLWPLDEHTDSCLRCRGQVALPLDRLVELLLRAASGEPVERLRADAQESYVLTREDLSALADMEAALVAPNPPARHRPSVRKPGGAR